MKTKSKIRTIKETLEEYKDITIVSEGESEDLDFFDIAIALKNGSHPENKLASLTDSLIDTLEPDESQLLKIDYPSSCVIWILSFVDITGKIHRIVNFNITNKEILKNKKFLQYIGFNENGEKMINETQDILTEIRLIIYPAYGIAKGHIGLKRKRKENQATKRNNLTQKVINMIN